jgi:2-polyprenyl-3-methyl-5-hydroxy-6-metoxy-1,4-benzoquinol methylase
MSLAQRSTQPEVMDTDLLSQAEYARCLRDLANVNRVTMTHRPTLQWLTRATRDLPRGSEISILDVGCGEGDLLRAIRRWSDKRGFSVTLEGLDLNPRSAVAATAATAPDMAIGWRTGDVFAFEPRPRPDYIVSSQFAHHLANADVVRFLHWLEDHAAGGWFISDLQRNAVSYYGFRVLALVAGWHRVVRTDGTISIARSFRRPEWERLLTEAGIQATVRGRIPFRLSVERLK